MLVDAHIYMLVGVHVLVELYMLVDEHVLVDKATCVLLSAAPVL